MSNPSRIRPGYRTGFARNAAESAEPGLWRGLCAAVVPALGSQQKKIRELVSGSPMSPRSATYACPWIMAAEGQGPAMTVKTSTRCWLTGRMGSRRPSIRATMMVGGKFTGNYKYHFGAMDNNTLASGSSTGYLGIKFRLSGATYGRQSTIHGTTYQDNALTWDGAEVQLWTNGSPDGAALAATGTMDDDGLGTLTMFNRNSRSDWQASGAGSHFTYFYLYDRALKPAEIVQLQGDPLALFRIARRLQPVRSGSAPKTATGAVTLPTGLTPAGVGAAKSSLTAAGAVTLPTGLTPAAVAVRGIQGAGAVVLPSGLTPAGVGAAQSYLTAAGAAVLPSGLVPAGAGLAKSALTAAGAAVLPSGLLVSGRGRRGDVIADVIGDAVIDA